MADRTREQMEAIIASGASVMLNSGAGATIATHVNQLPSAAMLARKSADKAKIDSERDALLGRKQAIERELQLLDSPVPLSEVAAQGQPTQLELEAKAKAQARAAEDMDRNKAALEAKEKALADERAAFEKAKADHEASLKATTEAPADATATTKTTKAK